MMGAERMQIPQMQPWLGADEQLAVAGALASGWISEGPQAAMLAERLNALIGAPYGVFAPNGTLALGLALLAAGIGPGDEVLVPDLTSIASANAVVFTGATPVFVDVEATTFQLDPLACAAALTPRTRAIMPVHLFGFAADLDALLDLAEQHDLLVIEDAAHAFGVRYRERKVGGGGHLGCFSFFADKTITTGEGGYVVCHEAETYTQLRLLRNQGRLDRGSLMHSAIGSNLRITDLQAAVGLVQLAKLDQIVARKQALLAWYAAGLRGLDQVRLLLPPPHVQAVPFRVVLMAERAAELRQHLHAWGVQAQACYAPLHHQPCFGQFDQVRHCSRAQADAIFPNATYAARHGVLLPAFPELSADQVAYVCSVVRSFYGQ